MVGKSFFLNASLSCCSSNLDMSGTPKRTFWVPVSAWMFFEFWSTHGRLAKAFLARDTQPTGQVMPSTLRVTVVIEPVTASSVLAEVEPGLGAFLVEAPSWPQPMHAKSMAGAAQDKVARMKGSLKKE